MRTVLFINHEIISCLCVRTVRQAVLFIQEESLKKKKFLSDNYQETDVTTQHGVARLNTSDVIHCRVRLDDLVTEHYAKRIYDITSCTIKC